MGKLIILRGNSGSGKTTVAKALQKKLGRNTMLISQDEDRRNMLWVDDGIYKGFAAYGRTFTIRKGTQRIFYPGRDHV